VEGTAHRPVPRLTAEDKRKLLQLARDTLVQYLGEGRLPEFVTDSATLLEPCATFVTLRRRGSGELRGCRGECQARQPLVEAVMNMAIAAATDDSRFPPVTLDEVPDLEIEISALTPLRPIRAEEVEVGRHGVMIIKGFSSGLLLPEVPVRYGWDHGEFLGWVCRKAGLPEDAWQAEDSQLLGFEAEVWGEET
jgi:AmmeMemoRadiSam system protein A